MRLTVQARKQIATKVSNHRHAETKAQLDAAIKAHGKKVWEALFPAKERAIMEAAPAHMFSRLSTVRVYYKTPEKRYASFNFGDAYPVTPAFAHYSSPEVAKHPDLDKALELHDAGKELERAMNASFSEVLGILEGFNTTDSLLRAWPEIEVFVPNQPVSRPMMRVPQSLNEKYKLPPGTKPAETSAAPAKKATKKKAK